MLKLIHNGLQRANISFNIFKTSQYYYYSTLSPLETTETIKIKDLQNKNNDEPIDMKNPFETEKQKCILCEMKITLNYKNVKLLSQFQSPYTGRIYGRHITGLCKKRQEQVENAINRAQNCALMPSYHKDVKYLNEPKLFDPERPIRPHKY